METKQETETGYEQEIFTLLKTHYPKNKKGQRVINLMVDSIAVMLYQEAEDGLIWLESDGQQPMLIVECSAVVQRGVYEYLFTNRMTPPKAIDITENSDGIVWRDEPVEIKAEDGELIGKIGIAKYAEQEGKTVMAVVFLSPDGTTATLTAFDETSKKSKAVAKKDLNRLAITMKWVMTKL